MPFSFYDNAPVATLAATQTSLVGSGDYTIIDIPGCSLSLSAGVWFVGANFNSARVWTSAASGQVDYQILYALRDGANGLLETVIHRVQFEIVSGKQRAEYPMGVTKLLNLGSTTTVKMSGYTSPVVGANFASGFRIDSGSGHNCTMYAIKVGA